MPTFKKYKFSDFVDINPLVKLKGNEEYSFIEMADLNDGQRYVYPSAKRILTGGGRFEENDTLFARITPCLENGKICQAKGLKDGKGFGSTEFLVFRGRESISDSNFVFYLSRWDDVRRFAELHMVGTSGRQRVPKDVFDNLELDLPEDLPTQIRIASILSSLDDKIELNRRTNHTLEQIAQTLFKKYAETGELVRLDEVIQLDPKVSLKKSNIASYVEMSDLSDTELSINNHVKKEFSGGSRFQNGDTLFARITPCLENGKTGFVNFLDDNEIGFGSTEFIVMRARENISQYYPYFIARDNNFRDYAIRSMGGTSGRQRVQKEMLLSYDVPKFDRQSMKDFDRIVDDIFLKIFAITKESKCLSQIRDSLLPKLLSGEIEMNAIKKELTVS